MSRTNTSIRNFLHGLAASIITYVGNFVTRRIFIQVLGAQYLGVQGTFSNILSLLSLAELGFGTAITFSLYKPLYQNDVAQIKAIMRLYSKVNATIAIAITTFGLVIYPFLPHIIGPLPHEIPGLFIIYLLFLLQTTLQYTYMHKATLIYAAQRKHITERIKAFVGLARSIFHILVLVLTKNFFVYLAVSIVTTVVESVLIRDKVKKMFPWLNELKSSSKLNNEVKTEITKNVKGVLLHRIGNTLVYSTDNILLTRFFGFAVTGMYSNYLMIITALNTFYGQIYESVLASLGEVGVSSSKEHVNKLFKVLNFFTSWLFGWMSICLLILINPFVEIWVGKNYLFSDSIVTTIVVSFYLTGMRGPVRALRSALGVFWHDRYKSIAEAAVNLVASVLLANQFGVIGIFLGTILSNLTVCFWVEPYMLYKHGLKSNVSSYFAQYLHYTLLNLLAFGATLLICLPLPGSGIGSFLLKSVVCLVVPNLTLLLFNYKRKEYLQMKTMLSAALRRRR